MFIVSKFELYGLAALLLACGIAAWRGGRQEHRIAAIVAVAWVGSLLIDNDGSETTQWGIFAIDLALAVWLVSESVLGRKFWPAFASGAQVLIVMTHVAFATDARIVHEAFFSAYYVWSYVVLICLIIGSILAEKRPARLTSQRRPC